LDGLRCVAFLDLNNQVVLQSRTKKIFPSNVSNNRIRNELQSILENLNRLGNHVYLDGELYNHTTKLQTLNHYARGSDPIEKHIDEENIENQDTDHTENTNHTENTDSILQYHVYDVMTEESTPFSERAKILEIVREFKPLSKIVQVVFTHLIQSHSDFENTYKHFINYGYEGMMIRDPKGTYQFGKRSGYLLKRKEVFTDEFPIVHFTSGTNGKDLNALIWICSTKNGIQFKVTPNLTYNERYELFRDCNHANRFEQHYKHRLLTVEYRGLSIDQFPQHAKGIHIRDIE
jgi:ATP-dependent DNA ligase